MTHFIKFLVFSLFFPVLLPAQQNGFGKNQESHIAPCLTASDRATIKQKLIEKRDLYGSQNQLNGAESVVDDLSFPLVLAEPIPGFHNYFGVSAYLDHNNGNGIRDYNCLKKSYNGHFGTDFFTFPFAWYLVDNDLVHVVSSAAGTILLKEDGNDDDNCTPEGTWNAVYIEHADGSIIWYGHLKKNSLTTKEEGDTVERGEYLGVVASSGFSTGPHLHIEYYSESFKLLDPYQGECNNKNENSLWEVQRDYLAPKVNAILTHGVAPVVACEKSEEIIALKNDFVTGDTIHLGAYFTDYIAGDIIITNLHRPDNSLYASFASFDNENDYWWYWNYRSYAFSENEPSGTWRADGILNGDTVSHFFTYTSTPTNTDNLSQINFLVHPNPAKETIFITGANFNNAKIQLVDCYGRIVKEGLVNDNNISLDGLATGLYYLTIIHDQQKLSPKKIIKY